MQETNILSEYKVWTCCACGVAYIIPADLDDFRRENGDDMYCCNGHKNCYTEAREKRLREESGEETKQDREIRDLKLKLLHEQEQREARQADGKESASDPEPASKPEPVIVAGEIPPIQRARNGRCICPYCSARPWGVHVSRHLKQRHGASEEATKNIKFA